MTPDLHSYDRIIVAFSGGKDSLACVLHLLDLGVEPAKIELWHHDVDGREGSSLMDWPCTRDYCRRVAAALGLQLYFSWKAGGFEREMSRDNVATAPIHFETPDGLGSAGGAGNPNTRRQFPQVSADLSVRWCSAYLKVDVCAAAIRNQARFDGVRTLFVSGERAEESSARARYKEFEAHRTDLRNGRKRRHVDHWRPVHAWSEVQVWQLIQRYGVVPHPAYRLGWGRVSCAACIFGSPNQWASLRVVRPMQFAAVAAYEARWGKTIHRKLSIVENAARGKPYEFDPEALADANSEVLTGPVVVAPADWRIPRGAFGESCGPT